MSLYTKLFDSSLIPRSKNRTRYPTRKLHIILNYILNAHPGVVSVYHDFDDLMTQILRGEAITNDLRDRRLTRTYCCEAIGFTVAKGELAVG